jgi:FkbM family methyltransferase
VQEGDRGEVKFLKKLLQPEHVFIDVGGNVGVFSLLAAKRVSKGQVHVFEPSPFHLKKLKANVKRNDYSNILIHPFGLFSSECVSKLYFPAIVYGLQNTGMASQFPFATDVALEETVRCVTLDGYAMNRGFKRIDVMKIDVEGAELDVLEGARRCIRKWRPHVVMEVSREHVERAGRKVDEVIDFWRSMGYAIARIDHDGKLSPISDQREFRAHQNIYCNPYAGDLRKPLL